MDTKKINEILSKAYSDTQNLISLADSKANISLTIHSLLITLTLGFSLLSNTFQKLIILVESCLSLVIFYISILVLFIIFSVIGIITTILIFKPREATEQIEKNRKGLFYFKHVLKYNSSNEYYQKIKELNEEDLIEEYSKQIFQLSYIARKKFKFVNYSIYLLITNMGLVILFFIISSVINLYI